MNHVAAEAKMYWLATIVSGAPFLGLLGTVWGVMDAFGTMDRGGATIEHLASSFGFGGGRAASRSDDDDGSSSRGGQEDGARAAAASSEFAVAAEKADAAAAEAAAAERELESMLAHMTPEERRAAFQALET